jgi:ABC-2 type transport system ATP-binding protein
MLSTHILSEVEMVCERVIIMHQGRIAAEDTMKNLRSESSKQYICEVKASAAHVEKLFSQIPHAVKVSAMQEGGWARASLSCSNPETDLRVAMYNAVREKGWTMRLLETKMPSLEDVFVEVTAK